MTDTNEPHFVDRAVWLDARKKLLAEEKSFTRSRDRLSAMRRALPVVRVEKSYRFETERGAETLLELFKGRSQLIVYHFMFEETWSEGCPSCSFWADGFDGLDVHLAARDATLIAISAAPLETLLAYRDRMAWGFDWVSSGRSGFNADFGVSFDGDDPGPMEGYNYASRAGSGEQPGVSIFAASPDGGVAHSYSTYGRGLDMLNAAYHMLDLTPKGRDELELPYRQAWVRRRDQYES